MSKSGKRTLYGIEIDYSRDDLLDDFGKKLLVEKYGRGEETSPQESFARAAAAYCEGDIGLAQRIYDYVSRRWFMFASPVLSNAPFPGENPKGLPISCYLTYVPDTLEGLIDHSNELRWMSVKGGGVGGHWSDVRSVSDVAPGPIPFIHTVDSDMSAYKQGVTRKGSYAAYMDISHPDIIEFLNIRRPTGDSNRKCLGTGFHHAINVTDDFMVAVEKDKSWNLIDPNDGTVRETVNARTLFKEIVEVRFLTGEPYINFIDTARKSIPQCQRDLGYELHGSNLCNEIHEVTGPDRSAVCCLSSLNLETYVEWNGEFQSFIHDMIRFLDNVTQKFIDWAPPELEKAKRGAIGERSLGLGTLGYHAMLQREMIPFESDAATQRNEEVYKLISEFADTGSCILASERGECEDAKTTLTIVFEDGHKSTCGSSDMIRITRHGGGSIVSVRAFDIQEGDLVWSSDAQSRVVKKVTGKHSHTGHRNIFKTAIAPNANSAIIIGSSPSIEPINSNAYNHKTRIGTFLVKNKYLKSILAERGLDTPAMWKKITSKGGSVQHIEELTDHEKDVFKTAMEIDQRIVVARGGDRQKYITQGQSLNIFFPRNSDREYVAETTYMAWKSKCKGLYYLRTESEGRPEDISQRVVRDALQDSGVDASEECESCSG